MCEIFGFMSMHAGIVLSMIANWTCYLETSRSDYVFMEYNIPEEQDTPVHNTFELKYPVNSNV